MATRGGSQCGLGVDAAEPGEFDHCQEQRPDRVVVSARLDGSERLTDLRDFGQ